jgi:hypothetical protein
MMVAGAHAGRGRRRRSCSGRCQGDQARGEPRKVPASERSYEAAIVANPSLGVKRFRGDSPMSSKPTGCKPWAWPRGLAAPPLNSAPAAAARAARVLLTNRFPRRSDTRSSPLPAFAQLDSFSVDGYNFPSAWKRGRFKQFNQLNLRRRNLGERGRCPANRKFDVAAKNLRTSGPFAAREALRVCSQACRHTDVRAAWVAARSTLLPEKRYSRRTRKPQHPGSWQAGLTAGRLPLPFGRGSRPPECPPWRKIGQRWSNG